MSASNDHVAQRNGRTRLKRAPAGKPTHPNDPMHCPLYYETTERLYKSSVRNLSHRNKTSMFDAAGGESKDSNSGSADKWTNKKMIAPPPGEIKKILQQEPFHMMSKRSGRRIHPEVASGNIFSKQSGDVDQKKSSKKTSSYSLNNNPYRWGVDVLRYPLPTPKRNYRHVDNLSTCLVPNKSADTFVPKKSPTHYVTQLEKSLCPKESASIQGSSRKMIRSHESKLEINCIPKNLGRSETKPACTLRRDNLNADLTPIAHIERRPFHINTTCRNKQSSLSFNSAREPSPFRSGKRIGYITTKREHSVFLC
ncbi:Uncharacterized protein PCOAH_00004340 [Plasmodium coatneyi]|uniref:Uncharacterized protein n=1 Tax=Plasmodium coatneyi TaxID=208452 RepID=A0A1B1DTW8_9APIC|nr:Uncharacterized protein PCOAH_00004340 [Plasmodium coatneyi]ANQ06089.1 Uncharacterized protein PCOAH_00004340 [Plasmodium coatneyi]